MNLPTPEDLKRFEAAREKIIGLERLRPGIGTLSEKTVHAVVKNFIEPDDEKHEIPVAGFVADILTDASGYEEIIEIQTRAMYKMKKKLDTFLRMYPVTIVYPIPREKKLCWVDEDTGEVSKPRKSNKKGTDYVAFSEIYGLKDYLLHPNIRFKLLFMDMTEYKILNGYGPSRKIRAEKYDRIPESLIGWTDLSCPEDYMQLIPADLPDEFKVDDFSKSTKLRRDEAGMAVQILRTVGVIEKIGKDKRAYVYRCKY